MLEALKELCDGAETRAHRRQRGAAVARVVWGTDGGWAAAAVRGWRGQCSGSIRADAGLRGGRSGFGDRGEQSRVAGGAVDFGGRRRYGHGSAEGAASGEAAGRDRGDADRGHGWTDGSHAVESESAEAVRGGYGAADRGRLLRDSADPWIYPLPRGGGAENFALAAEWTGGGDQNRRAEISAAGGDSGAGDPGGDLQ